MNRPAVFYSDLNHPAVGVRVPSDVARRQDATVHRPHGHPQPADALQLHHGARDPHQQRATECGAERAAKPDSAACDSPPASERGTPVCNYRRTALHHANYQLVSLLTNTTDHRVLDSQTLNASSKGKHDRDDSQVPVFPCLDAGSGLPARLRSRTPLPPSPPPPPTNPSLSPRQSMTQVYIQCRGCYACERKGPRKVRSHPSRYTERPAPRPFLLLVRPSDTRSGSRACAGRRHAAIKPSFV